MITLNKQLSNEAVDESLIEIVEVIANSCKEIAYLIRQGPFTDVLGSSETENIQGENQKRLDIISNEIFKNALLKSSHLAALASEEEESIISCKTDGNYLVAYDPLDGSSNIDVNGQIGSIFSIFKVLPQFSHDNEAQFFQSGRGQVCAGYVLYGPATYLVISFGSKTSLFALDHHSNEFQLATDRMEMPADAEEFSINMSNQTYWSEAMQSYIRELILGKNGARKKYFNMRWNGAMVGDVHRMLLRGGVFLYPSDHRNAGRTAKLRLLYEAGPIAMLIECAGGKAMTESQPILEVIPESLHQRVAVILGSTKEVEYCIRKLHADI